MGQENTFVAVLRGEFLHSARTLWVSEDPELIALINQWNNGKMSPSEAARLEALLSGPRLMDDAPHPEWVVKMWREADRTDPRARPIITVRSRPMVDRFGPSTCHPPPEAELPDGLEPAGPRRRPCYLELGPAVVGMYQTPRTWSTDHPTVVGDFIRAVQEADLATPAEAEVLAAIPAAIERALQLELDDARAAQVCEIARERNARADEKVRDFERTLKRLRSEAAVARSRFNAKRDQVNYVAPEKMAEYRSEAEEAESRVEPAELAVEAARAEASRALSAVVTANRALQARAALD